MKLITSATRILAAGAALLHLPALAGAQEPVRSFGELNTRLKVGDTIYVTDAKGREIKGKIRDLGPSAQTLDRAGPATFPADTVRLITQRKTRPIGRGALYGPGVGAGLGLAGLVDASASDPCDDCGGLGVAVLGFYAGLGAGAFIGAMMPGKTRVIYRAPGATGAASARLTFAPCVTLGGKGFAVGVRF